MATVPKHGDPIGERDDFVDAVRGEDDRDARRGELAHKLEQRVALRCGERGSRFVHHQDPRVERQRLGDLDQLLFADAQLRHAALRVDFDSEPCEQPVRGFGDPSPIDDHAGDQRLAAEEDVVGRRQFRDEVELLMNDRDPRPLGVLHACELHRRSRDPDDSVVLDVNAGEDLHQRRLAGAVLAHQRMNLAGLEVEVDVDQGRDPAKRFGHPRGLQDDAVASARLLPDACESTRRSIGPRRFLLHALERRPRACS